MEENKGEDLGFNFNNKQENFTLNTSGFQTAKNSEFVKTYSSSTKLYGVSFQTNEKELRAAVSSIECNNNNRIEVVEYNQEADRLRRTAVENIEFPCSKIMWSPSLNNNSLIATSSDIVRLYKFDENNAKINLFEKLNKKQNQSYSGPLTSLDWNKKNPSILGVCSIDTTCTIWDLEKLDVKTHLIAHDSEVYDICFGTDENIFLSTGKDGSIRHFDIRSLETCSVLFESQDNMPITRIAWNYNNSNFIAALVLDKNYIYIIDQRAANSPYAILSYHSNVVNAISWSPTSSAYVCSVGDDKNALIWDIHFISHRSEDPLMSFSSDSEIENVTWGEKKDEWIGITQNNNLQILKVK
jgi:WD repeat-containing protein 68